MYKVFADDTSLDEYVRQDLEARLRRELKDSRSVRLQGLPGIGISTVMRRFHGLCTHDGRLRDWFAFYLHGSYEADRVAALVKEQLEGLPDGAAVLAAVRSGPEQLATYCDQLAQAIRGIDPPRRVLFVLDDFQPNFELYRPGSLLTERNLEQLSGLVKAGRSGAFLVNYRLPLDPFPPGDGHLWGSASHEVGLLSQVEALDLVKIKRLRRGLATDEDTVKRILWLGGRHPLFLDKAAQLRGREEEAEFDVWATTKYRRIIEEVDSADEARGRRGNTLKSLRRIAKGSGPGDGSDGGQTAWGRCLCCREVNDRGEVSRRLFSPHFAEFLGEGRDRDRKGAVHRLREAVGRIGGAFDPGGAGRGGE
jgi:hypothetical protein